MIRSVRNGFSEDTILVVTTCVLVTNFLSFVESNCVTSGPHSTKRTELRSSKASGNTHPKIYHNSEDLLFKESCI